MVVPQPEPLSPWDQFKADLPGSFDGFIAEVAGGSHMAAFCNARGINYTTLLKFVHADPSRSEMYASAREDRDRIDVPGHGPAAPRALGATPIIMMDQPMAATVVAMPPYWLR